MSESTAKPQDEEPPARQPAPSRAQMRVPPPVGKAVKGAWVVTIYDDAGHKVAEAKVDAGAELEIGLEEA